MIGGSQVASWNIYPHRRQDPAAGGVAGAGSQTGERAKLNMGHTFPWKTTMNECMELADGCAKDRDLRAEAAERARQKTKLSKTPDSGVLFLGARRGGASGRGGTGRGGRRVARPREAQQAQAPLRPPRQGS